MHAYTCKQGRELPSKGTGDGEASEPVGSHSSPRCVQTTVTYTGGLSGEQTVQLGVALHVVVLGQTAPEGPEGGPALSQDPGHQGVHGPVDRLLPLAQHSVLGDADSRELTSLLLLHDNAFNSSTSISLFW